MPAYVQNPPLRFVTRCYLLAALALAWSDRNIQAQETIYDEDSVKAAFIYHFSTFVVWPDSVASDQAFVIAVLGDAEVALELQKYLPGRSIQGRPMRVRQIGSIDELDDEAVLFLGAGENGDLAATLEAVTNEPLLVVTEATGALEKGSIINFKIDDRRVRFEISLRAAEHAGLVLSSRLLSAAIYVDTTSAVMSLPVIVTASNKPAPAYH